MGQKEFEIEMKFTGVSLSIVDDSPQELLFFCLQNIKLNVERTTKVDSAEVVVGNMQVDNQILR